MAKESSFDIVSQTDLQEVDNAVQQAAKELTQRYDLKGTGASVSLDKPTRTITIAAPSEFVASQVSDVLGTRLVRRKVELNAISWSDVTPASGGTVRQSGTVVDGIDQDVAKRIAKDVRDTKAKVKVTVEGDKLRVASASKDALQQVIAFLRQQDYGQPLHFINYR
jgi:uncharacterized protein YajQ (UPF0234 family)